MDLGDAAISESTQKIEGSEDDDATSKLGSYQGYSNANGDHNDTGGNTKSKDITVEEVEVKEGKKRAKGANSGSPAAAASNSNQMFFKLQDPAKDGDPTGQTSGSQPPT